jgi:hypothetical protein
LSAEKPERGIYCMESLERIRTELISGDAFLGIELGSTRIKASLIDRGHRPIASGSFAWKTGWRTGFGRTAWRTRLPACSPCYADLLSNVLHDYGVMPKRSAQSAFPA